jgi:hypothetical protein
MMSLGASRQSANALAKEEALNAWAELMTLDSVILTEGADC